MKKTSLYQHAKTIIAGLLLALLQIPVIAQDSTSVNINTEQVESWFSQNWMWVAIGAVILIVLIAMMSGGSKKVATIKKTTIVKEEDASGVVKTTTTEIRE
jgi:protein-S-isoprenylcysteine O-methyltransferase Ste14